MSLVLSELVHRFRRLHGLKTNRSLPLAVLPTAYCLPIFVARISALANERQNCALLTGASLAGSLETANERRNATSLAAASSNRRLAARARSSSLLISISAPPAAAAFGKTDASHYRSST